MRLDKLLANKAYGSRKEVHQLLKDQRVTINGEITTKKDIHVDIESDVITVDGQVVNTKQQLSLIHILGQYKANKMQIG